MTPFTLRDFVVESNRIEGIDGASEADMDAHDFFLLCDPVSVDSLAAFVDMVAGAPLRDKPGMNVRIGNHYPIPGGPAVREHLERILNSGFQPSGVHHAYERLHPFLDGNGRSGRALWLHMMGGIEKAPLGFLHTWYYQSLNSGRS